MGISKTTVHRKRFEYIQNMGDNLREDIIELLQGKRLVLHFDGKIVREISEEKNISENVERIAVSVTSPDFDDRDDILLGVLQIENSKGSEQAKNILQLLEFYEITDNIFAICSDTTSSNTGVHSGAIVLLTSALDIRTLWLMCRHHIFEVHIAHFMGAITGEKTKGPRRGLYTRLQKKWPEIVDDIKSAVDHDQLQLLDWNSLDEGDPLHSQTLKALVYCKKALETKKFERGDYRKLCELTVVFLGGEVENFKFSQPGAHHEARFMADAIYLLTLQMTRKVITLMDDKEKAMVEKASLFAAVCYGPWFLQSNLTVKAPAHDLQAFKVCQSFRDKSPEVADALTTSISRHAWYLSESTVIFALADDDVLENTKKQMIRELVKHEIPDEFSSGKPSLPKLSTSSKLEDFIGEDSWFIFVVLNIPKHEVGAWLDGDLEDHVSFRTFSQFIRGLHSTNDCAERNIKLIQDFVMSSKNEEMRQNIMLVARDNRMVLKESCNKTELNNS